MRTIKFRGKRIDNGEWVYGSLDSTDERPAISWLRTNEDGEQVPWFAYVKADTVGQFSGLTDQNGKEIYEGDIITLKGDYPRVVLWDKMSWALMPTEYYHDEYFWVMNLQHPGLDWWEEYADEFEIIGNIYENPDMLKGGNNGERL